LVGGTLNKDGTLYIKALKVPGENTLNVIAKLIEQTQMRKASIEKFAGFQFLHFINLYKFLSEYDMAIFLL
jgi:cation transport ATPase